VEGPSSWKSHAESRVVVFFLGLRSLPRPSTYPAMASQQPLYCSFKRGLDVSIGRVLPRDVLSCCRQAFRMVVHENRQLGYRRMAERCWSHSGEKNKSTSKNSWCGRKSPGRVQRPDSDTPATLSFEAHSGFFFRLVKDDFQHSIVQYRNSGMPRH
jgi:hypothetical protein